MMEESRDPASGDASQADVDMIQVNLRCVDGRRETLEVPRDVRVQDLADLVGEEFGVLGSRIRMICRGRALAVEDRLNDYIPATENNPSIHVVFRNPPPETTSTTFSAPEHSTTATSAASIRPELFLGAFRIEGGTDASGAPQFSLTTEIPANEGLGGANEMLAGFLSSFMDMAMRGTPAAAGSTPFVQTTQQHSAQETASLPVNTPSNEPSVEAPQETVSAQSQPAVTVITATDNDPLTTHDEIHARAVAEALSSHERAVTEALRQEDEDQSSVEIEEELDTGPGSTGLNNHNVSSMQDEGREDQNMNLSRHDGIADQSEDRTTNHTPPPDTGRPQVSVTVGTVPLQASSTGLGQLLSSLVGRLAPNAMQTSTQHTENVRGATVSSTTSSTTQQQGTTTSTTSHSVLHELPHRSTTTSGQRQQILPEAFAFLSGMDSAPFTVFVPSQQQQQQQQPQPSATARSVQTNFSSVAATNDGPRRPPAPRVSAGLPEFIQDIADCLKDARAELGLSQENLLQSLEDCQSLREQQQNRTMVSSSGDTSHTVSSTAANLRSASEGAVTNSHPVQDVPSSPSHIEEATAPGTGPTTRRRRTDGIWISNAYINDRLPWHTLKHMADILQAVTGWHLPPVVNRGGPGSPPPLTTFLLMYQQVNQITGSLFSQIQAWQDGTGQLAVSDLGHAVTLMGLNSSVQASLASLCTSLFLNLALHVDPSTLQTRMRWDLANGVRLSEKRKPPPASGLSDRASIGGVMSASAKEESEADEDAFTDVQEESPRILPTNNLTGIPNLSRSFTSQRQSIDIDDDTLKDDVQPDITENQNRTRENSPREIEHTLECLKDEPMNDENTSLHQMSVDDSTPSSSLNVMPSIGFSNNHYTVNPGRPSRTSHYTLPAGAAPDLSDVPGLIRDRFLRWTSNTTAFSRAVLSQARQRTFSNTYNSGDPTAPMTSDVSQRIPAIDPMFALRWRHAGSRVNASEQAIEPPPEDVLSESYVSQVLGDISHQVRTNPDFAAEPQRFPNLQRLLRLFQSNSNRG